MKRPASSENVLKRIKQWRITCPELTIRSTFIVGFPGETEEDFQELLDFLEEAQLDRVGCFQYSPVEGAKANDIGDPVPESIKQERYDRFMQCQSVISTNRLKQKVGLKMEVLIDGFNDDNQIIARSKADAPEVDGIVIVDFDNKLEENNNLEAGDLITVMIHDSDEYDLYARL